MRRCAWFRHGVSLVVGLALVLLPAAPGTQAAPTNPRVLPPHAQAFGKSYGQWGAQWWMWALAQPLPKNPVLDQTGEFCDQGQSGKVWFLAGTFGGTVTRACEVPTGTAIFFPIYNIFNDYPCPDPAFKPDPGQSLEDFLTNGTGSIPGARDLIDPANPRTDFRVTVDGRQLKNLSDYRATSKMVTFTGDLSMQAVDPCITGSPQQGVADGYWVMLAPLPPGQHTVHIEVHTLNPFLGQFDLDVSYNLTVVPKGKRS